MRSQRPSRRGHHSPDESRRAELERALKLLRAGKDAVHVIEALSQRLTNKLLHEPLKSIAG